MNYGRSVAPPSPRRSSGTCYPRDSEEPRHGKMSWRDETRPREKRPLPPKRCDHASRRRDAPDVTEYKIRKPHASSLRVLAPSPSLARALSLSLSPRLLFLLLSPFFYFPFFSFLLFSFHRLRFRSISISLHRERRDSVSPFLFRATRAQKRTHRISCDQLSRPSFYYEI